MRYLFPLTLMGFSSLAFAGAPNWTGFAGLADADKDGYPAFVGTSTATSTGYSGAIDCDDGHVSIYPGATEVVADGNDQDCNGKDLVLPVSRAAWDLFVKNEYGGKAPSASRYVYEFDQCTAAVGKCVVDKIDGRFKVTDDSVKFADIYVNGGDVLRNNGQKADGREVVTLKEIGLYRGDSASGAGLGTKAVTKIVKDAVDAAVKVETDERKAGQLALADETKSLGEEDIRIIGLLSTEEARAVEAERLLRERLVRSEATANSVASHGPLIEVYALVGTVIGASITDGDYTARNAFGGGAGAGINVGADVDFGRVNAFADAIFGADGGASLAHSEAIGLEIVGEKGWGGFAAYSVRSSQPNSLETEVLGRNPLVGVSFVRTFAEDGAKHGLFQVRAGLGPEFIGMSGDSVTDGVGLAGRLTVSVGGGIGALQ